jgi:hypothetical protein
MTLPSAPSRTGAGSSRRPEPVSIERSRSARPASRPFTAVIVAQDASRARRPLLLTFDKDASIVPSGGRLEAP